jgi:hypothetical protein
VHSTPRRKRTFASSEWEPKTRSYGECTPLSSVFDFVGTGQQKTVLVARTGATGQDDAFKGIRRTGGIAEGTGRTGQDVMK